MDTSPLSPKQENVAANGLLNRRLFLRSGAGTALAIGAIAPVDIAAGEPLRVEPWMRVPGAPFVGYGQPSRFEGEVVRIAGNPRNAPGTGAARTPLHRLNGTITPNGLHFERSHSGIPDINPEAHRLLIHGLVKRSLVFTLESLSRYPTESRIAFIDAPSFARLRRQHASEMASAHKSDRRPDDDEGRDIEIHHVVARWEVTAIRLPNGSQIGNYAAVTGPDVQVQDEIAGAVVAALKVQLQASERPVNPFRTESSEAHNHYLLGMRFLDRANMDDLARAAREFRQSIALDPNYGISYAGLASVEFYLGDTTSDYARIRNAISIADKAIALAPEFADGYTARGRIRFGSVWDWAGAQSDFEKAVSLDPRGAWTLDRYATLLLALGRGSEAAAAGRKAVEADPLSSGAWEHLGILLATNGELGAARESLNRALELEPQSNWAHFHLGITEILDGHAAAAADAFRQITYRPGQLLGTALSEGALGHARESEIALQALISEQAQAPWAYQIGEVYAFRGDNDRAFEWLERAYAQHDGGLATMKADPLLRGLRGDPRFKAMLNKIKMPD